MTIIERWLPLAVTTIDRSTVLQYSYTYVQLLQHVHVVQHGTRKFPCATKGLVYDMRPGSITDPFSDDKTAVTCSGSCSKEQLVLGGVS